MKGLDTGGWPEDMKKVNCPRQQDMNELHRSTVPARRKNGLSYQISISAIRYQ